MQPNKYQTAEPNLNSGFTSKYKKNIASIIFTSMLADLAVATRESCLCNNFVLGGFHIFPSAFAKERDTRVSGYFKTSPTWILCLRAK